MSEIEEKLKQLSERKRQTELEQYVSTLSTNELTLFIKENINRHAFIQSWINLLQAFIDEHQSHEKRLQLTLVVLQEIDEQRLTEMQQNEIVMLLRTNLPKYTTTHLVRIYQYCIERIQKGNVSPTTWKDLIPIILEILIEKDLVTDLNNVDVNGIEFRKQVLQSLCVINWSADIIIPMAQMFKDITLTKDEHLMVVTKLCQYIEKLTCPELPPFIYNLLYLCSQYNSRCIYIHLQHYYAQRIYNKKLNENIRNTSDTESSIDLNEINDCTESVALQSESTVLLHIMEASRLAQNVFKDYLNAMKCWLKAPEFVLHPFQLTLLLMISDINSFEDEIIDMIRNCIVRAISEDFKGKESEYFNKLATVSVKINNIVLIVIENNVQSRISVISGLINLAFTLLSAGCGIGNKNVVEVQWKLGKIILTTLMKKRIEVSATVLSRLRDKILTGQNVTHLTDCLYEMCRHLKLMVLENRTILIQLVQHILIVPGTTYRSIIDAIMPLINVLQIMRDQLIIALRKALYSRKIETSQMAVYGFIQLLRNLRISNLIAFSQSEKRVTNFSFLTQLTLESQGKAPHTLFSNEALCLEVLEILRRCFTQEPELRIELYEGFSDAAFVNTELSTPILDQLWTHFLQFYNGQHDNGDDDEDILPPLKFTNIYMTKNTEIILKEPIGNLIFSISLIVTNMAASHANRRTEYTKILQSLCECMAKCDLIHFDLGTAKDLFDTTFESQSALIVLKEAMSVYEALIGYLILSWKIESNNHAQQIHSLFQAYSRLVDFSKNLNKPKKVEGRKKSKDNTTAAVPPKQTKVFVFKPNPTVLNFQTTEKILSLLLEPNVCWTNSTQANQLKCKREFHCYILRAILQLLQTNKATKTTRFFNYCTNISVILVERVVKQLTQMIDFDCTITVLAVECFSTILTIIANSFKEDFNIFLNKINPSVENQDRSNVLMALIKILQDFIEKDQDDYNEDPEIKKLPILLVNTHSLLISHLSHEDVIKSDVLKWLKEFTNNNTISNKQVGHALISTLLNMYIRYKTTRSVFENVAIRLCNIIGTINLETPECPVSLNIINEGIALPTLISLTNCLKTMLNETNWLIQRFRAEYSIINFPSVSSTERRKNLLIEKERDLCCDLIKIIRIFTFISNSAVPSGPNSEAVIKTVIHLYSTLISLTKYFLYTSSKVNPAFQKVRYECVLQMAGKRLSKIINQLILHVENVPIADNDGDDDNEVQSGTKRKDPIAMKSKVLRETRSIPKLVYEMEQFHRHVLMLSNKTNVDLSHYMGVGMSRDFKIRLNTVKEALEKTGRIVDDTTENSSAIDEEIESVEEQVDEEQEVVNDKEEEIEAPPKKKSKN